MVAHNPSLGVFALGERLSGRRGRKLHHLLVVIKGGQWLGWIVAAYKIIESMEKGEALKFQTAITNAF